MHDKITRLIADGAMRVDKGSITGYAVTWDFNDDGIQYTRGCFNKSITERAGKIPLLVEHAAKGGGAVFTTVGILTRCIEDDKGLLITADFLDTELGQAAREQALAGGVKGMSLGTRHLQGIREGEVLAVKEAMLVEVTLTNIPRDAAADVVNVRSKRAEDETSSPTTAVPEEERAEETSSLTTTPAPVRAEGETPSRTTTGVPVEPPEQDTPREREARERCLTLFEIGAL